jgi:seryl-tRNA(Sec) selenium transferase
LEVVVFEVLDALRCAGAVVVGVSDWPAASCAQTEDAVIEKTTAIAMERWFLFTGVS